MPATLPLQVNEQPKRKQPQTDPAWDRREMSVASSGDGAAVVKVLRSVLRQEPEGKTITAEQQAAALVDSLQPLLLRYCEGLVRNTTGGGRRVIATERNVDAEDLAQEAWLKSLRYLAGPRGDRVLDDEHLRRLLRTAAKQVFLDRVTKGGAPFAMQELDAPLGTGASTKNVGEAEDRTLIDVLPAPTRSETAALALAFLNDERYVPLIEMLFGDEDLFHSTYRRKHQRRPRQYQAFVLYQLGTFYRSEAVVGDIIVESPGVGSGATLMKEMITEYVKLLGIPDERWLPVAQAALAAPVEPTAVPPEDAGGGAEESRLDTAVLAAVNVVCGTNIKAANMLAVLRYELNQFVEQEKEGAPQRP